MGVGGVGFGENDKPPSTAPLTGPVGGRLRNFAKTWALFCSDGWVLKTVSQGYALEFTSNPPSHPALRPTPIPPDPGKRWALENEINSLLRKQAIKFTQNEAATPGFMSTFFLTPKKHPGEWRPILNLRPLNKFIRPKRFRMETLRTVLDSISLPVWGASLDLEDAYLHVPIMHSHTRYLRFRYKGVTYEFQSLPFGLSTAPRVFTRLVKVIAALLRQRNICIFVYLDDWLVVGKSEQETHEAIAYTHKLASELGFKINEKKSCLTPTQQPTFLGAELDLQKGVAYPTQERIRNLVECTSLFLNSREAPAQAWLRLLGLLASMVDVVPWCRLRMRPLQLHLLAFYQPSRHPISLRVPVLPPVHPHLRWWSQQTNLVAGLRFPRPNPTLTLTTDASNYGWGAHMGTWSTAGQWSMTDKTHHINVLELLAVQRALLFFRKVAMGHTVLVRSDNSTVVAYINKQGGTHSPQLCMHAWRLLCWCMKNRISLIAVHLAGRLNTMADALSRGKVLPTEWTLHPGVVQMIFQRLDRPHIDLFASALNNQLPIYCARYQEPQAWATDALSISWANMFAYAFPPISLLPRVLAKIKSECCRVILIAPFWPRQPWFQSIVRLLIHPPLVLPQRADLLSQPRSRVLHLSPETLHLTCWLLSSDPFAQQAFQRTLRPLPPAGVERQQEGHITAGYDISISGAGTDLLIPAQLL